MIPQILFQCSGRPPFQADQEESHGCRQCFEATAQSIQTVDQAGCLAPPFTKRQDILLRMRQDIFAGLHGDCVDRPRNDVPVYLPDLVRRGDQVTDAESRYIMRFRNRLYQDQVRMVADIRRFEQPFRRESDVCLVDDKDRLPVRLDQGQQFGPADQSAVRIVRVTDPAKVLSFQREAGQVA